MLTTLIIVLLGLALFTYVALPLVLPRGADPLPPQGDPITIDLEEEKTALFRAIKELDLRDDLPQERRAQLRARYEAKAAKVLRVLDERSSAQPGPSERAAPRRKRAPYGALALLAIAVVVATSLSAFVFPRVGDNSTVTTFFQEDLDAARQLRDLQQVAERTPSAENLLALADGYWQVGNAEGAAETYRRATEEAGASSSLAYRRLGFLTLQSDLNASLGYLERARELDPTDLDTLYALGEIYFSSGDLTAAEEAWQAFSAAPGGAGDPQVGARLQLVGELQPLAAQLATDPNQEALLVYADALWRADERGRAVETYFQVLTEFDPNDPQALGRTGQLLFLSGRNEDAIALMERAAMSEQVGANTLLFLGNAYYSAERFADAIEIWERHLSLVGEEQAGRVPGLIEDARARLGGEDPVEAAPLAEGGPVAEAAATGTGERVFAQNCAGCHGQSGMGASGPRLAGNSRAVNEQNVRNAVSFGRGMMPGFTAVLSSQEIDAVVEFVTERLSASGEVQ
ncbi:MAG: c-type cytochrome [Trueperaceae bacterium]